ncbi:hypothetical protein H310_05767 [Aphanomyces invadans]|uniref:Glutamyl-tRNA(Gln) amidotransferase subunit C, mitochondrial n=1 Tax=Aphanomyces invadans TaxID=157072 RepID=A0A024U7K0_9STRA|nr:hypothetical protein H310_05767 [Aphanomyces invadans]ETW02200.1 hypothetical protein H310_05767 [Aphanomyces invadans]|eukprot:XP_008868805.1 hypothetical protein H310_05767 [Aphanomyces invadans]
MMLAATMSRRLSTKSPLVEISRVPRTASWSLEDLHRHPNQHDVLTRESFLNLAELSHLYIPDDKLPKLMSEVEAIIQCTRVIQEATVHANVHDVYSKNSFGQVPAAPLREDVVTEGNCPDQVLANASTKHGYFFQVPKVLEE